MTIQTKAAIIYLVGREKEIIMIYDDYSKQGCFTEHVGFMDAVLGLTSEYYTTAYNYAFGFKAGKKYLEENNLDSIKLFGYNSDEVISKVSGLKQGDTVVIKKGTNIHAPFSKGDHKAGRNQKVKIHHFLPGNIAKLNHDNTVTPPTNPQIVWAGAGGY